MKDGVDAALKKASGNGEITPESYKKIAELLGVSVQFIYNAKRKGFFPPERARVISDDYRVPLARLVSPQVAALLHS
jgi:hypothetical protein